MAFTPVGRAQEARYIAARIRRFVRNYGPIAPSTMALMIRALTNMATRGRSTANSRSRSGSRSRSRPRT